MRVSFLILIYFFLAISPSHAKNENGNLLLKDMREIKIVSRKNFNQNLFLFSRTAKYLEKSWDERVLTELGRLIQLTYKVDSNYYIIEPFSNIIIKNKKKFLKSLKKVMSKDSYEILVDNVKLLVREVKQGNG